MEQPRVKLNQVSLFLLYRYSFSPPLLINHIVLSLPFFFILPCFPPPPFAHNCNSLPPPPLSSLFPSSLPPHPTPPSTPPPFLFTTFQFPECSVFLPYHLLLKASGATLWRLYQLGM